MARRKQYIQFAAIYSVRYVSWIKSNVSFQFWVYVVWLDVLYKSVN